MYLPNCMVVARCVAVLATPHGERHFRILPVQSITLMLRVCVRRESRRWFRHEIVAAAEPKELGVAVGGLGAVGGGYVTRVTSYPGVIFRHTLGGLDVVALPVGHAMLDQTDLWLHNVST